MSMMTGTEKSFYYKIFEKYTINIQNLSKAIFSF